MATIINSPSSNKTATAAQGWTISATNWLAATAAAMLAPVLPKIAQHFQGDARVALMVSLVATLPALFIALCAWLAGLLADRFGTRRILLYGVGIYGFLGCAPMLLNSLIVIIVTRAVLGIAGAMMMVCTTALVADYFQGSVRDRWFAIQTGGTGVAATMMILLSGLLGQWDWRLPFALNGSAFILFAFVLLKTWEPSKHAETSVKRLEESNIPSSYPQFAEKKYNWLPMILICLITIFTSMAFYVVIIQLSFILSERGVTAPGTIGMGAAIAVLFMAMGSALFKLIGPRQAK